MTNLSAQEMAQACADSMWRDDKASQALGMQIVDITPGRAQLTMNVRDIMTNGHGICHGGYIFTLADSAFAFACNGYNQRAVGQQAAITYVAPAKLGDILTASAQEVWRKDRSGIYDVHVVNQHGEAIAEFRGHCRTIRGAHLPDQV